MRILTSFIRWAALYTGSKGCQVGGNGYNRTMSKWLDPLQINPLPDLLSSGIEALAYFVQRDLLDEPVGSIEELWELPEPAKLVRKQGEDGSWRYPGKGDNPYGSNYDLLETFRVYRKNRDALSESETWGQ